MQNDQNSLFHYQITYETFLTPIQPVGIHGHTLSKVPVECQGLEGRLLTEYQRPTCDFLDPPPKWDLQIHT